MNNFGALYWFEFRKIMKNRVTLVTFLFFMVLSGIMGIGQTSLREGDSAMAGYRKIDGRLVDDALMEEMIHAADEYGVAWTLSNMAYDPLCYWVRGIVGYGTPLADHNAEEIYQKRIDGIQNTQIISHLTERELEFWAEKEEMVQKPFTWRVTALPQALLSGTSYNMIVLLFLVTISLSMIFAGETQVRTAPMIFASKNGRNCLYFAKVLAGMSYIAMDFVLVSGIFCATCVLRWGTEGLDAAVQLLYPFASLPIRMGDLVVILLVLLFFASLMLAGFAMMLSELFRNALAVMGVMLGGYLGMFALYNQIPYRLRFLSQAVMLLPSTLVTPKLVYEYRLVNIGGHIFTAYQAAPVLYMILTIVFVLSGRRLYLRRDH